MSEETNAEQAMRFRESSMDEANDWERKEWAIANEGIDLYFIPKLMEYDHIKKWYVPNILQWHTPNVRDGGIMLSVAVLEKEIYSNEDAGWVSRPSNIMEFTLGQDSFIGMKGVYSRASIDRNIDALCNLHINPTTKSILVDIVSNPEDEMLRQWLLKNDMHGVVYQRKQDSHLDSHLILKSFQKNDVDIHIGEHINEFADLENPEAVEKIKRELGLE
jgi:hypothetical protein